jgi:hypothetical protein
MQRAFAEFEQGLTNPQRGRHHLRGKFAFHDTGQQTHDQFPALPRRNRHRNARYAAGDFNAGAK